MNRNIFIALALIALIGAGAVSYMRTAPERTPPLPQPAIGDPAAADRMLEFSLADIDGNRRAFSEWHGKARLVNFWATWCAPCRREIPLLKSAQEEHGGDSLQVIGVAVDFVEDVRVFAEDAEFNYPILVGQEDAMAAAEASGVELIGMPFTLVVSQDGYLIKAHTGEIEADHIRQIVEVFARLERGEIDLAGARDALKHL